jgi:hypothetical protein
MKLTFAILFAIQFCLDIATNKCLTAQNVLILLIHHQFSIMFNFGWLLNDKTLLKLYLILCSATLIHWQLNDSKCISTEIFNKNCGYTHYEYFHDFFYFAEIKSLHTYYIILAMFIALYKILFFP